MTSSKVKQESLKPFIGMYTPNENHRKEVKNRWSCPLRDNSGLYCLGSHNQSFGLHFYQQWYNWGVLLLLTSSTSSHKNEWTSVLMPNSIITRGGDVWVSLHLPHPFLWKSTINDSYNNIYFQSYHHNLKTSLLPALLPTTSSLFDHLRRVSARLYCL